MKKRSFIELLVVSFCSFAVIAAVVMGTGAYFSGWHLVDDHELFEYIYKFDRGEKIINIIKKAMAFDIFSLKRLRLIYFPVRILQALLFRFNAEAYYLVRLILSALSLIMLYYCGREMYLSRPASACFSLISLVGPQSATWWKLGPQNIQGTLFFAVGFLLLLRFLKTSDKVQGIASIVSFVIMANYHESFILVLPFIALFPIYCSVRARLDDKDAVKESIYGGLRDNTSRLWYIVSISIVFVLLIGAILILFGFGREDVGMSYNPIRSAFTLLESLRGDLRWYWYFGLALFGVLLTYYDSLKKLWPEILMTAVFIAPQLALYGQSGLYERYLLPICIGYSLFFVVTVFQKRLVSGKRKLLYTFILIGMLAMNTRYAVVEADYYRFRGESVTTMLNVAEKATADGFTVASCLGQSNPEADMTLRDYMRAKELPECLYWDDYSEAYDNAEADLVIVYNRDDRHYTGDPNIDFSNMKFVKCGSIDLFLGDEMAARISEEELRSWQIRPTIYGIGTDTYGY